MQDRNSLEMRQLDEYNTFSDIGKDGIPPKLYNQIKVHLIYDIKHNMRLKARCVADGYLAVIPLDSIYSRIVSLQGLRMMTLFAKLNQFYIWSTGIVNAYLEINTSEKFYITAGKKFGNNQGNTLLIHHILYGLLSSGVRCQ